MKMKKIAFILLSAAAALFALTGCGEYSEISGGYQIAENGSYAAEADGRETEALPYVIETESQTDPARTEEAPPTEADEAAEAEEAPKTDEAELTESAAQETAPITESFDDTEGAPPQTTAVLSKESGEAANISVEKNGSYTAPEDVAEYIHTFGTLPDNFITKSEAKELGWDSSKGNLWDVAEGKSIGGDYFGNYEGLLPKADGRRYTECDVNYGGGYRGGERIIFSNDGLIFYTDDHYQTFTQIY
ncbi:MAG: hypothetical protein NC394_07780 [Bacteroides sp.]|nr:hypothetical protein [Bacteroides sp.]